MKKEIRPCVGYEGYYCDNFGNIYGKKFGTPLSFFDNGRGYYYVGLFINGKRKNVRVHRLIAEAFIENPNGYKEINHKDENKHNNCVDNLEWCSRSYNTGYGNAHKKHSENAKRQWEKQKSLGIEGGLKRINREGIVLEQKIEKENLIKSVFLHFCRAELSRYELKRAVVKTREIAKKEHISKYKAERIIKELVNRGLVERVSIGCPALVSETDFGLELICESAPPVNGYAITEKGFKTDLWEKAYSDWEESMKKWCDGTEACEDG